MITINDDGYIIMTRGDTLCAELSLAQIDGGEEYVPGSGDVITFEMKRFPYDSGEPDLSKTVDNESLILRLSPDDTESLPYGEYAYKCIITYEDGNVDTFIDGVTLNLVP